MSNPNFKQEFDNSLQRLAQINTVIDANLRSKQEFSARIVQRLTAINDKVKQLGNAIRTLKDQLTNLQAQAAANNNHIADIGTEVNGLKGQIAQLTDERNKAVAELDDLKNKYQADTQALQKRIDDNEANTRQLTDQNMQLSQQRDALQAELTQKGDLGAAHAAELKNLTDQHTQALLQKDEQLKAQQDANTAQIQQLQAEIAAKEEELNKTISDVGNNAAQLQAQIEQLTREKQEKDAQIAQLQGQITDLQNENQDLINRIIAATQAIAAATNRLQELNDPAAFNEAELDVKFQELEASVQEISNAIQAGPQNVAQNVPQNVAQNVPQNVAQQRIPGNTRILYENTQFTLDDLRNQLQEKSRQDPRPNNKYSQVLQQLQGANDEDDVKSILQSASIMTTRNGKIKGGKKTKKNKKVRKQKGGYTYKVNSKRRSITTSSLRSSSGRGRGRGHSKRR